MNDNFKTPTKETIDKNLISTSQSYFKLLIFRKSTASEDSPIKISLEKKLL